MANLCPRIGETRKLCLYNTEVNINLTEEEQKIRYLIKIRSEVAKLEALELCLER